MTTDSELLRQYAVQGDDAAFAQVVRRHTDLVYSAALRVARDAALAEDVTQIVFTKLARAARTLGGYQTLVGWLHTTTRHTAINAIRGEARRRAREQETMAMQNTMPVSEVKWEQLRPVLDEAVGELGERDRQAVLLRYFNGLSHQEVGAMLGLSENSANKRVERALEKLREQFARRGVTASSGVLAVAMSGNSVQAAPAGLAERVAAASLAEVGGTVAGGALGFSLLAFLMSTKNKIIVAGVVLLLLALTCAVGWRGSPDTSATSAESAPVPAKMPVKPAVAAPVQIAAPVVKPAAVVTAPAPAPTAVESAPAVDPRLEVGTAMKDFARLLEVGDYVTAANDYMQLPPNVSGVELVQMMQLNPDIPKTVQMLMESTNAAQTTTPTYNDAGDMATYELSPPVDAKATVRWKRINGMWKVDGYE